MKINITKVKTYIGFAIKSRNIKFGVDDIIKLKKAYLILFSDKLSENAVKKLKEYALKNEIVFELIEDDEFKILFPQSNIKATAILDSNLADAIKKNLAM